MLYFHSGPGGTHFITKHTCSKTILLRSTSTFLAEINMYSLILIAIKIREEKMPASVCRRLVIIPHGKIFYTYGKHSSELNNDGLPVVVVQKIGCCYSSCYTRTRKRSSLSKSEEAVHNGRQLTSRHVSDFRIGRNRCWCVMDHGWFKIGAWKHRYLSTSLEPFSLFQFQKYIICSWESLPVWHISSH